MIKIKLFLFYTWYVFIIFTYGFISKQQQLKFGYFTDLNFSRYIFALCTSWWCLKSNRTTELWNHSFSRRFASLNIYVPESDHDKLKHRFYCAVINSDDRGFISCLSTYRKKAILWLYERQESGSKRYGQNGILQWMQEHISARDGMTCTNSCYDTNWSKHRESCNTIKESYKYKYP